MNKKNKNEKKQVYHKRQRQSSVYKVYCKNKIKTMESLTRAHSQTHSSNYDTHYITHNNTYYIYILPLSSS